MNVHPETQDHIRRFLLPNTDIRGEIVTLEHSYREALENQTLPEHLRPIAGQFLCAAAMISEILKFDGRVTVQARGDGPVSLIMAECNAAGELRGTLSVPEPASLASNIDQNLQELIGRGALVIILEPAQGERYQGIVSLEHGSLGDCLAHYFEQSEQIPTYFSLFADHRHCGGLFLQCLPSKTEEDLARRDELWETALYLTNTVEQHEFFTSDHESLLYRIFHEHGCQVFPAKALRFKCQCSRERSARALRTLPEAELLDMLEGRDNLILDCQFCGKRYVYSKSDVTALLRPAGKLH